MPDSQAADLAPPEETAFPLPLNEFVGRGRELAELAGLLTSGRLITVTGPPGAGKTRLALECAARRGLTARFVDVAGIDRVDAADALAASAALAAELLILDTCDHLIDVCARLLPELLRAHPRLRVLATSREALGIAGETLYRVGPLPAADAVKLFLARAVEQRHPPVPDELPARICGQLDGLPLAIELAASRLTLLSPEQIADRIQHRLDTLAGGGRSFPPRQRSFAAAMEWSYLTLTGLERNLLDRLTVFESAFRLEDAEQVCTGQDLDRVEVLDGMAALVARSLLSCEIVGRGARYAMLATVRRYVRSAGGTGEHESLALAHVQWCTALAERVRAAAASQELSERLDEMQAHHADALVALAWCRSHGRPAEGLRLASALAMFWTIRGQLREGCDWFAALLGNEVEVGAAGAGAADYDGIAESGRALIEYGALLCASGEFGGAQTAGSLALRIAESHKDQAGRMAAQLLLGNVKVLTDPAGSGKLLDEFTGRADEDGAWWTGIALALQGYAQAFTGDLAAARQICVQCVEAAAKGSPLVLVTGQIAFGHVALAQGDFAGAERALRRGLDGSRELGHTQGTAMALHGLGLSAAAKSRADEGKELLADALTAARLTGSPVVIAQCLNALAVTLLADGDTAGAAGLHRDVLAFGERATTREVASALLGLCHVERANGNLANAGLFAEEAAVLAKRVGDRTVLARSAHALGVIALDRGLLAAARAQLRDSLALRAEIGLLPEIAPILEELARLAARQGRNAQAARMRGAAHALRCRLGVATEPSLRMADASAQPSWEEGEHKPLWDTIGWVLSNFPATRQAAAGWAGLTRAEHQVARLAAEGLTNREIGSRLFVSPRTVQTHLSHAFAKLGVSSRRELGDHMAARTEHLGDAAPGDALFRVLDLPSSSAGGIQ